MAIQEIGIVIDLSRGTFNDTVYQNNKLQLVETGIDSDGKIVYKSTGYWESEPILVQDKITAFKNVVKTMTVTGGATYKIYVRTSQDGILWGAYVEVAADGSIINEPEKYAMIKIEIFASKGAANFIIDNFSVAGKYSNEYVNSSSGVLELKKEYVNDMENVSEDATDVIFISEVNKTKFKKINTISVS
jgi:hypothetical protein